MKYSINIIKQAVIALCITVIGSSCTNRNGYATVTGYAQGGTYVVKLDLGGCGESAENVKAGIDSILSRIDNSISGYNEESLLSRFNRGEIIVPDDIFIDIYDKSYGYYEITDGSFDVSAAALFDIWGFGFTADSLPSEEKISAVLETVGMDRLKRQIELGEDGSCSPAMLLADGISSYGAAPSGGVTPSSPALPKLNYNAVAQGYSCDLVADYLHGLGVKDMLVDIGGEIFCEGKNPRGLPWTIGLDKPIDGNNVSGQYLQGLFSTDESPKGIVTSGNYRKFYVKDGRKYAHTINPRTGCPVTHSLLSATVVAPTVTEADALATYCMVLGLGEAKAFIDSRDDLEACFVYDGEDGLKVWTSEGFTLKETE